MNKLIIHKSKVFILDEHGKICEKFECGEMTGQNLNKMVAFKTSQRFAYKIHEDAMMVIFMSLNLYLSFQPGTKTVITRTFNENSLKHDMASYLQSLYHVYF